MNMPIPSADGKRARWTKIAAGIGLLLVGALTVINSVELSHMAEQNRSEPRNARIQALAAHVADLAGQLEQYRKRPDTVPLKRYDAERQTAEQRLMVIERILEDQLPNKDLQPLQDRLTQLERRLTRSTLTAKRPNPNPNPNPNPVRAKTVEPSFQVIIAI
jgi:hypothetical protein